MDGVVNIGIGAANGTSAAHGGFGTHIGVRRKPQNASKENRHMILTLERPERIVLSLGFPLEIDHEGERPGVRPSK
jgi:hypothetical protein